jgi:hypothetical protein
LTTRCWRAYLEEFERVRAYRRQHPDALMTFDTPEAALAALDSLDD